MEPDFLQPADPASDGILPYSGRWRVTATGLRIASFAFTAMASGLLAIAGGHPARIGALVDAGTGLLGLGVLGWFVAQGFCLAAPPVGSAALAARAMAAFGYVLPSLTALVLVATRAGSRALSISTPIAFMLFELVAAIALVWLLADVAARFGHPLRTSTRAVAVGGCVLVALAGLTLELWWPLFGGRLVEGSRELRNQVRGTLHGVVAVGGCACSLAFAGWSRAVYLAMRARLPAPAPFARATGQAEPGVSGS